LLFIKQLSHQRRGIAAVQNRSRLKNKCKPNDMKQNSKSQAGHSSNTLVGGSTVKPDVSRSFFFARLSK